MRRYNPKSILIVAYRLLLVSVLLSLSYPSISPAGSMTDIGTLGGTSGVAYSISSGGTIVGSSYIAEDAATHAFVYANGIMTDLGTLPGGGGSEAYAINNAGRIVGASFISPGTDTYHAFLYVDGIMTDLGTLGGDNSVAYAINTTGQIVGASSITPDVTDTSHAFLYYEDKMTDLGTLGGKNSVAYAINNAGQVAGTSSVSSDITETSHAFLYSEGKMIDIGALEGMTDSTAHSINGSGQIAGASCIWLDADTQHCHAFLYSEGKMTDIGTLDPRGGGNSRATAINDAGQVVGWSDTASGESHAFLYSNGKMKDLGALRGGHASYANAINNAGQVAGWSFNSSESFRAILYSPGSASISAKPSSLNFGPVKKDGNLIREITVRNSGPGNLIFGAITLTGLDTDEFSAVNDCSIPLIRGGDACTITVTFRPVSYGPKSATLAIASSDPKKPSHIVALKGDCPYPKMVLSPSSLDFGGIPQKETSGVRIVTIRNTSPSDLNISSIKLSDEVSFARTDSCSTVVKGTPCKIELTFTPQGMGSTAGLLTISSDDQKGSASVELHGKGK